MRKIAYRRVAKTFKPSPFTQALDALTLASKNLKNIGLFIIKNTLSSFDENTRALKPARDLHENQKAVILLVNRAIASCNALRQAKNEAKIEERAMLDDLWRLSGIPMSPKEIESFDQAFKPANLFIPLDQPGANPWVVLDHRLLDKALRLHRDQQGRAPFEALPSKAAEQVRMQIISEFSGWRCALSSYKKNPEAFTGPPMMPSYLGKSDRNIVKFFAGSLGKKSLPDISGRALYNDFGQNRSLPKGAFQAYERFGWGKMRESLQTQIKRPGAELIEIRLVPKKNQPVKFEGVFKNSIEMPEGSFYGKLLARAQSQSVKEKDLPSFFLRSIQDLPAGALPRSAGFDLGMNNLFSVAFSTGEKSIVVSCARIERKMALFGKKLDGLKAKSALPLLTQLEQRKANGEELSRAETVLMRQMSADVHQNPKMAELLERQARWIDNALHQATTSIARILKASGVELAVVGRNKGWKQESDLGKTQNRRFHALPHARLISMLRYKLEESGILLIETEESHTSQMSFAANEAIPALSSNPAFKPKASQSISAKEAHPCAKKSRAQKPGEPTGSKERQTPGAPLSRMGLRQAPKGARSSAKHQFLIPRTQTKNPGKASAPSDPLGPELSPRWASLHADANGAFNILRKVMPAFRAHEGLSSGFTLMWQSPRGLLPFAAKAFGPPRQAVFP